MNIDWTAFTPWHALGGGALIGLAAAILIVANGQIAGISGILAAIVQRTGGNGWRLAFVAGLLAAPLVLKTLAPALAVTTPYWSANAWPLLALAGFLVGFGTRLANGCTSGHGVCGLARLSLRSLWAVLAFMGSAMAVTYLVRHVIGGVQ
nr:YeeE/YedE family protein [Zoogloeaceae bacterium]